MLSRSQRPSGAHTVANITFQSLVLSEEILLGLHKNVSNVSVFFCTQQLAQLLYFLEFEAMRKRGVG